MIELSVSLASNGVVKVPGYEQMVRFGYTKNQGVYRLHIDATGEWEGLTIRAFWHVPDGKDPASSLVVDGYVAVPASVTAQPGSGCVTFEGSDGTRTVTSADLRYRVAANSGTDDGSMPEPGTPAWQQLVDAVHTDATAAEQAKTDAQTAATESAASAEKAAASKKAAEDAKAKAAESLQELKNGIASGNFKGDPGVSPTVTVQDITGGHRIVITDETGTSSVDVLNGKQGDPGKPGDTGATPELTIGTVKEGDAPSATITGTAKNPVLNLTLKSGAPGKDGLDAPQIDDAVVSAENPWSSRKIIETLCPPLEESGNPLQCYPVAAYPLGVTASWEPVQAGSGEPSPENIRPIKGRDSVQVERCGENLYNVNHFIGSYWVDDNYHKSNDFVNIHSSFWASYKVPCNVGDTINVSGFPELGGISCVWTSDVSGEKYFKEAGSSQRVNASYAVPSGAQCLVLGVAGKLSMPDANYDNAMISIGAAPTTYSPYTGQTSTLTLPRTIYGGTVDAVTGEGQESWKLVTLDGTENWEAQQTAIPGKFGFTLGMPGIATPEGPGIKGDIVCNQYPAVTANDTYRCKNGISVEAQKNYYFRIYNDTYAGEAADEWKSYLSAQYAAGTPVQIAYKMATPEPFTATGAQPIPALPGVNTVLTDADSVTVTGRADPIKRITDLEDAVASMTNT